MATRKKKEITEANVEVTDAKVINPAELETADTESREAAEQAGKAVYFRESPDEPNPASKSPKRTRTTRQKRELTADEIRDSDVLSSAVSTGQIDLDEKRKKSKAAATEQESKIGRAGATAKTHDDVIRDSRARARERAEKREEMVAALTSWASLADAQKHNRVLFGMVIAVEKIGRQVVAVADLNGFRAIIPFDNFYLGDPIDYSTVNSEDDLFRRQRQVLTKTIGLRTPMLVEAMEGGENGAENAVVVANRKAALERQNERYFINAETALKKGDHVDAYITAVGPYSMRVLIGGVEVSVPKARATNRYIEYMSERFALNQKLDVVITDIIYDTKNGLPTVKVDARDAEREEMAANLRNIRPEGIYIGRITHMHYNDRMKQVSFHLHITQQDVVAVGLGAPLQFNSSAPQPGDAVVFEASRINYERGYVSGRILKRLY